MDRDERREEAAHAATEEALDNIEKLGVQLRELRDKLRVEKGCREANKHAVATTVGGIVEGAPTSTLNYLQRLRELVEIEKRYQRLREAAVDVERIAHMNRIWMGVDGWKYNAMPAFRVKQIAERLRKVLEK